MTDGCGGTRFPPQPLARIGARELGADHLERDRAAEAHVLGRVDDTHAALAELAEKSIVTDAFAHVKERINPSIHLY